MKANIGDTVHVKATVLRVVDRDGHHLLNLGENHLGDFYAPADCIVHVETRPIKVGDKVRHPRGDGDEYEVLGVRGEWLWVAREGRDPCTCSVSNFERVTS